MVNPFEITFEVEPKAKGRPRFTKRGFAYTPKDTRDFETLIQAIGRESYKGKPLSEFIRVDLFFGFKRPKKPSKPYPRPDVDNCCKAILDALNEIVWNDDSQVIQVFASKGYTDESIIKMRVTPLPEGFQASSDLREFFRPA